MPDEPAEIVQHLWRVWAKRDKAAAIALFSPDIVYDLHIPEEVVPFGGETRGKAAVSDRLQMILDQFDTLLYAGHVVKVDGEKVHGLVDYRFRHKLTGEVIDGSMRHQILVRDGRIVSLRETHDIEKVKAFMRLVSLRASEMDVTC